MTDRLSNKVKNIYWDNIDPEMWVEEIPENALATSGIVIQDGNIGKFSIFFDLDMVGKEIDIIVIPKEK